MADTRAAGQLEKPMSLVIPPSHDSALHLARGMAKWRGVKCAVVRILGRSSGAGHQPVTPHHVHVIATPLASRSRILGSWPDASMNLGRSAAAIVVVAALVSG